MVSFQRLRKNFFDSNPVKLFELQEDVACLSLRYHSSYYSSSLESEMSHETQEFLNTYNVYPMLFFWFHYSLDETDSVSEKEGEMAETSFTCPKEQGGMVNPIPGTDSVNLTRKLVPQIKE